MVRVPPADRPGALDRPSGRRSRGVASRRDPHEPSPGRRPRDPLLRHASPRPRGGGHPRPARRSAPTRSCATTRCWASGWPSPPTGRPAPSCRRPTSARLTRPGPGGRPRSPRPTTRSSSSRTGSRRWRPGSTTDLPPTRAGQPGRQLRPGFGRCEVVCFTSDHDRVVRRARARARAAGGRRLGRPDGDAVGARRASSTSSCSRTTARRSG